MRFANLQDQLLKSADGLGASDGLKDQSTKLLVKFISCKIIA